MDMKGDRTRLDVCDGHIAAAGKSEKPLLPSSHGLSR
jgi:hypothetical protein